MQPRGCALSVWLPHYCRALLGNGSWLLHCIPVLLRILIHRVITVDGIFYKVFQTPIFIHRDRESNNNLSWYLSSLLLESDGYVQEIKQVRSV
jgi:hypothetical protein